MTGNIIERLAALSMTMLASFLADLFVNSVSMPSTVIASFEYDKAGSRLTICFVSGSIYEYYQVPEAVFNQFKQYREKGVFYNRYIKGKFEYTKKPVDKK